jgi:hypothetical protein
MTPNEKLRNEAVEFRKKYVRKGQCSEETIMAIFAEQQIAPFKLKLKMMRKRLERAQSEAKCTARY